MDQDVVVSKGVGQGNAKALVDGDAKAPEILSSGFEDVCCSTVVLQSLSGGESDGEGLENHRVQELLGPKDLMVVDEGYRRFVEYLKTLTKSDTLINLPIGWFLANMFRVAGEVDRLSTFSLGDYLSCNLTTCVSVRNL
ncbi:hypothetical protein M5689_013273 [Euphorbia peplus]|nr:hypothetical protein M5689_013273 [Euphorbia peplus]